MEDINIRIQMAVVNYPSGSKFKSASNGCARTSTGRFYVSESGNVYTDIGSCVYNHGTGRWAKKIL